MQTIFASDPYDTSPHADVHQLHQRHLLAGDGTREFSAAFFRLLDGPPTEQRAEHAEQRARAEAAYTQLARERPKQAAALELWCGKGNLSEAARREGLTPQALAKRKAAGLAFVKAHMRAPQPTGSPV